MSNPISLFSNLVSAQSLWAGFEATVLRGLGGNVAGDGIQNGGLLIVEAGGNRVIFSHVQDGPADHVPNHQILTLLNL